MSLKFRIIGSWYLTAGASVWVREGAGAWTKETVYSGGPANPPYFYPLNDAGPVDIIALLTGGIDGAVSRTVTASITAENRLKLDADAGLDIEVAFEDPASSTSLIDNSQAIRDCLYLDKRGTRDTITIPGGGSLTADRALGFYLSPKRYLFEDWRRYPVRASQAIPDDENTLPSTLRVSRRKRHRFKVRLTNALPRALAENEYIAWEDVLRQMTTGRPWRMYPDTTVTSEFEELVTPYGFETYITDANSFEWEPEPRFQNFQKIWEADIECWKVATAP